MIEELECSEHDFERFNQFRFWTTAQGFSPKRLKLAIENSKATITTLLNYLSNWTCILWNCVFHLKMGEGWNTVLLPCSFTRVMQLFTLSGPLRLVDWTVKASSSPVLPSFPLWPRGERKISPIPRTVPGWRSVLFYLLRGQIEKYSYSRWFKPYGILFEQLGKKLHRLCPVMWFHSLVLCHRTIQNLEVTHLELYLQVAWKHDAVLPQLSFHILFKMTSSLNKLLNTWPWMTSHQLKTPESMLKSGLYSIFLHQESLTSFHVIQILFSKVVTYPLSPHLEDIFKLFGKGFHLRNVRAWSLEPDWATYSNLDFIA